jgi:uncharacterized protein YbjQ (UPF0145 family)
VYSLPGVQVKELNAGAPAPTAPPEILYPLLKLQHPTPEQYGQQQKEPLKHMIITNIPYLPGYTIVEHFGLATGSTVQSKHFGRDMMAYVKNIFGGELKGYTELLNEARQVALKRLYAQAESVGANAVLNVRFSTTSVTSGAAEL